ncbi:MAG TPA: hypothetical protein ENI38_01030, partial [Candidatus Acetothermia bacterium]|nr:hypothetical protein [Candidatus Acetothermia bacterium]
MDGYPDGFVTTPPRLPTQRWADALALRAQVLSRRLGVLALDLVAVGVLWILVSYTVSWNLYGEISYTLIPWWAYGLGVVEVVAFWEAFGHSLGFKVSRRELRTRDGRPSTLGQRLRYFLGWHLTALPLWGFVFDPPLHERMS